LHTFPSTHKAPVKSFHFVKLPFAYFCKLLTTLLPTFYYFNGYKSTGGDLGKLGDGPIKIWGRGRPMHPSSQFF